MAMTGCEQDMCGVGLKADDLAGASTSKKKADPAEHRADVLFVFLGMYIY